MYKYENNKIATLLLFVPPLLLFQLCHFSRVLKGPSRSPEPLTFSLISPLLHLPPSIPRAGSIAIPQCEGSNLGAHHDIVSSITNPPASYIPSPQNKIPTMLTCSNCIQRIQSHGQGSPSAHRAR
jgi:hypothetical protein